MAKKMLKLNIFRVTASVLLLLAMVLPLFVVNAGAATSGSCGEGLSWSFSAGTLTITGSGVMSDYRDGAFAPWYDLRGDIIRIELPQGLSTIGDFAFIECKNLRSVSIPDTVTEIGSYAFAACEKLTSVKLSNSLQVIGTSAFYNCYAISSITLPYGLREIGSSAFYRCESLPAIKIPVNVQSLGTSVFAYCKNLIRAEIDAPIKEIPAWTFFGCSMLVEVSMQKTVDDIENNAFTDCEVLTNVYHPAEPEKVEDLEQKVIESLPSFEFSGNVTDGAMSDSSTSGRYTENDDDTATQTNVTVWHDSTMTLEYSVSSTFAEGGMANAKKSVGLKLTLESNSAWELAVTQLRQTLTLLKQLIGDGEFSLKIYLKNDASLSKSLTDLMAGRNVKLEIMSASGSVWRVNGKDLVIKEDVVEAAPPKHDFSYTVKDAAEDTKTRLGTALCYELTFSESMENKAEILIQLPPSAAVRGSNAYLYQIEDNGEHTRLQGVRVDNEAIAHFYLASTDKGTRYVIGIDVPSENADDVIIPDELLKDYNDALLRLEEIEYVATGKREIAGMGLGQIMVLTFVIIAILIVVVGVIMFFLNKKRLAKQNYRPA